MRRRRQKPAKPRNAAKAQARPVPWTACIFPRPAPIEAYGKGGFRFAGMSHRGSLLCLPDGDLGVAGDEAARTSTR